MANGKPNRPIRPRGGGPRGRRRVVIDQGGALVPGAGAGRGVYTCRRLQCFERAASRRAFNRTLRETVRVDLGIPASLHWNSHGQREAE